MALGKQAKILTRQQVDAIAYHIGNSRNGLRNKVVLYLSVRAGLRAKEIAELKWTMVLGADGEVGSHINLTNQASKGQSGRIIPINKELKALVADLYEFEKMQHGFNTASSFVIRTERGNKTTAQVIVNQFYRWYQELGLVGCSSHSGRRTFITNAARKISTVGGSIRDVQILAGHSSLGTTQKYIEGDSEARNRIVDII